MYLYIYTFGTQWHTKIKTSLRTPDVDELGDGSSTPELAPMSTICDYLADGESTLNFNVVNPGCAMIGLCRVWVWGLFFKSPLL